MNSLPELPFSPLSRQQQDSLPGLKQTRHILFVNHFSDTELQGLEIKNKPKSLSG